MVVLALIFPAMHACGSFDFTVDRELAEVFIPGATTVGQRSARLSSDVFGAQSWDEPLPQVPSAIFVDSFRLHITETGLSSPSDEDSFAWLEKVVFYLEPTKAGSLLPKAPIAFGATPGAVSEFTLTTNQALDLVPYILEGFQITSEAQGRAPTDDVTIRGTVSLSVDAL